MSLTEKEELEINTTRTDGDEEEEEEATKQPVTDEEQKMNVTERIHEKMRMVRLYFYEIYAQRQSLDHLRLQSQRL